MSRFNARNVLQYLILTVVWSGLIFLAFAGSATTQGQIDDESAVYLPLIQLPNNGTIPQPDNPPNNSTPTPTPTPTSTPTPTPMQTASPSPTTEPTPDDVPPDPGDGYSITFPEVSAQSLGDCPAEAHDRYVTTGPDGLRYRTWHPIYDAEYECHYAHEHGDPPHPDAPDIPFGYVSYVAGSHGMIAAHAGYKVFTHYANGDSGFGAPELDLSPSTEMNWMAVIHQGTSGAGRLSVQFHDFVFWSDYGGETLITAQADTGVAISKCTDTDSPGPIRVIPCAADPVYEMWNFQVDIGGAWSSPVALFAVVNPPTVLAAVDVESGLVGNCADDFTFEPCEDIAGPSSFFLGNMRTIHDPDWFWSNEQGEESFCTNAQGEQQDCSLAGSIVQTVASIEASHDGDIADRTANASGFQEHQDALWTYGAPGGN